MTTERGKHACPAYAGLLEVDGINFDTCSLTQPVFCPFCMSPDAALLAGRVSFTARMDAEDVGNPQPIAVFLCPASHLFMVRQRDILAAPSQVKRADTEEWVRPQMNPNRSSTAQWLDLYQAAATECDIEKLPWKIGTAIEAIDERVRQFSSGFDGSVEEKAKIDQALLHLLALLKQNAARGRGHVTSKAQSKCIESREGQQHRHSGGL
jgi:hypothetical protein